MRVTCPKCQSEVARAGLNIQRAIAVCDACGEVFGFGDRVPGALRPGSRPQVALPPGLTVAERPFRIVWRWFRPAAIFLALFAVVWNGIIGFFVSQLLRGHDLRPLFFISLHLAVGVLVAYHALCMFANRTAFSLDGGHLRVRHGPLPWPGGRDLAAHQVQQLWCQERSSRNGTTYELHAELQTGVRVKLVRGLPERDQALYLEQALESRLGIEDRPVDGELVR